MKHLKRQKQFSLTQLPFLSSSTFPSSFPPRFPSYHLVTLITPTPLLIPTPILTCNNTLSSSHLLNPYISCTLSTLVRALLLLLPLFPFPPFFHPQSHPPAFLSSLYHLRFHTENWNIRTICSSSLKR